MKNKIIAALLTLSMLLSQCLIIPTFAASDYEGHWAKEHIDKLITAGVVAGDENGKINPDNSIKRSEFVKIVNRKFNFTNAGTENFPDVSADAWYANEFKIAKAQGYLTGDDKGNANPDNPITRAEVSVIIARVLKLNDNYSSVKPFSDDTDIPSWSKESVYRLNLKGYINGYPDGSFKAQNTITRAESFTIIAKITTNSSTPTIPSGGGFGGGSSGGGGGGSSSGGSSGGGGSSSGGNSGGNTEKEPENKDRTPEELKELNDNKEPEIESREDSGIGLYTGVYSEVKVDDVDDAIDSLENVKTLLNIDDVEEEFVPFDDEGSKIDENTYKIQQVYNGVPVANAQTIISVNEEGYPDSILNRYDDSVRLSGINTTPSISETRAKEIILADLIAKDAEYTNGNIESIYVEIQADQEILTYHAYVTCDNSLGFNYYVDAHSGEVVVANEVVPQFDNKVESVMYFDSNMDSGSKINVIRFERGDGTIFNKFEDIKNNILVYKYNSDASGVALHKLHYLNPDVEEFMLVDQDNNWIDASNYVQRSAFYALYNMPKIMNVYKNNIGFDTSWLKQCQVAINLNKPNAYYIKGKCFSFGWHNNRNSEYIRELDTVGHEYTHYFQDVHVNNFNCGIGNFDDGTSLADDCGEKISGNLKWVEACAISEGTADIMGMLSEYLAGEAYYNDAVGEYIKIEFNSPEFWLYAEDSEYSNESEQEDHYSWAVVAANGDDEHHITVKEMTTYYKNHDKLKYMEGPGHSDRYILVRAFSKMIQAVANDTNNTNRNVFKNKSGDQQAEIWFKLWGNAIKKLTPSSDFADMRLALLNTANELGFSFKEKAAIKKGLDAVGITEAYNADIMIRWYMPYVNRAVEEGVISANETDGFRYNDPVTRAELITMACNYCQIDLSKVKVDNVAIKDHWAAKAVQLGYNYGVLTSKWLNSKDYLNQTIPRWEAANVLFGIMNISEVYHRKTGVWYASLNSASYNSFKAAITGDWGVNVFKDETSKLNLLNMNRGYKDNQGVWTVNAEFTDIASALSHFTTQHLWNNNSVDETDNAISYFGLYQLWANGKSYGQEDQGKRWLKMHDQMTRGEVCAILYK